MFYSFEINYNVINRKKMENQKEMRDHSILLHSILNLFFFFLYRYTNTPSSFVFKFGGNRDSDALHRNVGRHDCGSHHWKRVFFSILCHSSAIQL